MNRRLSRCRAITVFAWTALLAWEAPAATPHQPEIPYIVGVNYVSWTTGDYPFTTSWKRQTCADSQSITQVAIAQTRAFAGRGALQVQVEYDTAKTAWDAAENKHVQTHTAGEVFVDLRNSSGYIGIRPYRLQTSAKGKPLGVDLSGKTIGFVAYCGPGSSGPPFAPNGLQIFLKSCRVDAQGNEQWSSYYSNWQNIATRIDFSADRRLGDVLEGQWSLVCTTLPARGPAGMPAPPFGYCDPDFDPSCVALAGVKWALNDEMKRGRQKGSLTLWIDLLGWCEPRRDAALRCEFEELPREQRLDLWRRLADLRHARPLIAGGDRGGEAIDRGVPSERIFFDFEQVTDPLTELARCRFNTVAIVDTEYMERLDSTTIRPVEGKSHGEAELRTLIAAAHARKLRVILKPHIDVIENDLWRGTIQPQDVPAWFESYAQFLMRYARLAQETKAEMLCVGTELKTMEHRPEWRKLIEAVRAAYSGKLIYAANWDSLDAFDWSLVDVAGIDAYFPLSDQRDPSLETLVRGWSEVLYDPEAAPEEARWKTTKPRNWIAELEAFHTKTGKPIVFTEIGYRPTDYAAREPWDWEKVRPINLDLQRRCYQSVALALREKPWFRGACFWLWSPQQDAGGPLDGGFTPQGKPAAECFVPLGTTAHH